MDKLDLKDDVLRRANGFYTYFAADIAYHRNKLDVRGFDRVINVWGADHHGHVARLQAALDGLGLDGSNRLVIVLMQLVNLLRDGEPVRMSKRSGKAIALSRPAGRGQRGRRPVLLQLPSRHHPAGLRPGPGGPGGQREPRLLCAVRPRPHLLPAARPGRGGGHACPPPAEVDAALLATEEEQALHQAALAQFREEIRLAARDYDPSHINRYLTDLAGDFHRFYNACRIKGEEPAVLAARLKLADSVRSVLANGLNLLGVTAPEKM